MTDNATAPRPRRCRQLYVVALPVAIGVEDQVELPPAGLLRLRGSAAERVERAARLPYRVVVIDEAPLERAARSARDTRRAALGLATGYDGVAIDMFVPQVVDLAPDDVTLEISSQWFAFDYTEGRTRTHGLERFGLPELECREDQVPQPMIDAVLVGLSHRLVGRWPREDPGGLHRVGLGDIARGYGQVPEDHGRSARVGVSYREDEPHGHLMVRLLDDPADTLFA